MTHKAAPVTRIGPKRQAAGGVVGLQGLLDVLTTLTGTSPAAIVIAIENYVRGGAENEIADDGTQLVLAIAG